MKLKGVQGPRFARRSLLKGAGALALAPLLMGFGGNQPYATVPAIKQKSDAGKYNTKLILLGTTGGMTWWPGSNRANNAQALMVGDAVYVIDLGAGACQRLSEAFNWGHFVQFQGQPMQLELSDFLTNVRALFFTHMHLDHLGDYPMFLEVGVRAGLASKDKLKIFGPCDRGRLDEMKSGYTGTIMRAESPDPALATPTPGIRRTTELLLQTFATTFNNCTHDEGYPDIPKLIDVRDIGDPQGVPWPKEFSVPDPAKPWTVAQTCPAMDPFEIYRDNLVRVSAILVDHHQVYPSFAFRFDTDDGSLAISGDTGPNTNGNLQKLAKGADVLVHEVIDRYWIEAAYKGVKEGDPLWPLYDHVVTAHTSSKDVGKVAAECGVKKLVLSHIAPGNTPLSRLQAARDNFSGAFVVGEDLMRIGVGKPLGGPGKKS
jgi:ribonuclease BN (tRNA processing enzyme)